MAVGTATVTHYSTGHVRKLVIDWVADSTDGTMPDTVLPRIEGRLLELTTDPGSTAPTANYDLTLIDDDGIDRLMGVGANRHTTSTESVPVVYSGSTVHPVMGTWQALTLKWANQAVHSATGRIVLLYGPA